MQKSILQADPSIKRASAWFLSDLESEAWFKKSVLSSCYSGEVMQGVVTGFLRPWLVVRAKHCVLDVIVIISIIKINPTECIGLSSVAHMTLPQNLPSALLLRFFWSAVKFELVHPKAVQTVFVFGHGKVVERKAVETEK